MRTQKLLSHGKIGAAASHLYRTRPTPNADPDLFEKNQFAGEKCETVDKVKARLPAKVRKNAVLAVEVLMTASPEYFADKTEDQVIFWKEQSLEWCQKYFGGEKNLVDWAFHLDETTPHIHAIVVPIDPKGKLNARHFLGGADKLSQMQTDYAQAMSQFKLDRGIKKSIATHQEIKKYYGRAKMTLKSTNHILQSIDKDLVKIEEIDFFDKMRKIIPKDSLKPAMEKIQSYIKRILAMRDKLQAQAQKLVYTNDILAKRAEDLQNRLNAFEKITGIKQAHLQDDNLMSVIKRSVDTYNQAKIRQMVANKTKAIDQQHQAIRQLAEDNAPRFPGQPTTQTTNDRTSSNGQSSTLPTPRQNFDTLSRTNK